MPSIRIAAGVVAALSALTIAESASAQTPLRAVCAFPDGHFYCQHFETFIKEVNDGKSGLQINYLGGAPKVMSPFEVAKNLKSGVIEFAAVPGGFYTNVIPESDALKLAEFPNAELRRNGAWELINRIHNEKANAWYLGKTGEYHGYHIYLNKPIDKASFAGLKIRVVPIYRAMVETLGATAVTSPPAELYTMLERNTVDGYGFPLYGIFDFSWQKVTKFRIEPGFYVADMNWMVNLDAWKKLSASHRTLMQELMAKFEAIEAMHDPRNVAANEAERKRQAEAGIKPLRLPPAEEQKFVTTAYEAAWASVLKNSPEYGPRLKQVLTRP
jgi:TRAP-type C4-dicarboxylate transport system substrate-binding protein